MTTHCPACGWVMCLHPDQSQTWCPCGWREGDLLPTLFPVQLELLVVEAFVVVEV